jgi:hypothetical protein
MAFRKKRQLDGWRKLEERDDYLRNIIHQKAFLSRKIRGKSGEKIRGNRRGEFGYVGAP